MAKFKFATQLNDESDSPASQISNAPAFKFATNLNSSTPSLPSQPVERRFSKPNTAPIPSAASFNMLPAHTLPKAPQQSNYGAAWARGTLGSIEGRALTPLAEKLTGKDFDISTLPESDTWGEKAVELVGSIGADLPLWAAGDALLAKPLGMLAKSKPVASATSKFLPKAIQPALGTGVRAAATFGGPINALETGMNGDGVEGFTDRLKEAPLMALGGTALHGAGQLAVKGAKTGLDYSKFNKLTKLPQTKPNPLADVQNAYKSPLLRDAQAQQLNKTFADTQNVMSPARLKPLQQGIDDALGVKKPLTGELLQQRQLDAQSAFGGPRELNKYHFKTGEQRAFQELQDGITEAQNYVRHTDVLAPYPPGTTVEAAYADLKANTGVDLPKLMGNWERAQAARTSLKPKELDMGRKAGVVPPLKPRDLPKAMQNNLEGPLPRMQPPKNRLTWTNKDGIQNAGQLPIRSITQDNLGQLPGRQLPPLGQELGPRAEVLSVGNPLRPLEPTLPDTSGHIVSKTEKQIPSYDAIKTNAYIKTTDNLHRLNQLDRYVEDVTGQKLSPKDRAYMLALNSRGTGSTTSHILEEGLVNPQGEVIGDSLKTITKQLKNSKVAKEFDDYLVNKHAITRMRAGEKVFPDEMKMTPEMSEAKVKEIEALHPEFKDLSQKLYDFQNKLSKAWLVDTGIVPPEAWGRWIMDNPHYVPNNRLFSELEKTSFGGAKRGFANQSNPVKARTGSERQIISPLESIMEHTDQYVKVARRNEVMQTLIRNLQKDPESFKGWAEIIPSDGQLKEGLTSDINKTLQTEGIDGVVEQFNKQFDDIFNAKKQRLDLGNIVTGIVNGEKVHVKVNDPLLLDALTNLKPQAQQVVVAALGQVTRVMKNLTTGINPMFGLARNIWRDIPTAFINSKSTNNPLVFGKDLLGSIVDVIGNKELYKSYKAMGGGHASSSVSTGRNALAESKARLLPGYALKHPFKTALGGLERINNAVETAPRLGEFKRISKPGDYASKVKGIYESNDVTTNFNKFGNTIKEIDSIVPYLNAAWQGIDKFKRTFQDNPIQASAKALVAITFPTVMLYQLNRNNPAYQQLSDYIKDNNFLIPKGDGTFVKIPKPREIGVVFGSSVERTMRQWEDGDPDAFNRFMETIKTNFMPPSRTIVHPLMVDLPSNKNFIGAPIVSGSLQKLSPRLQFDEKTSEPAKMLGKALNQSPQQIDYLARSYLGGIAQLGLPALTKNASVGGVLKKQVTADPVFSNDIIGDFYNTKDKIDTSASDAKATGNKSLEVGQKYKPLFNNVNAQLGDIRKQIDKVQASELSSSDKETRIRDLQIKMLTLAKEANSKFKLK